MDRRQFSAAATSMLVVGAWQQAHALSLGDLTDAEASKGLRAALTQGAAAAVKLLGKPDGFLGNEKVRIPLPGFLEDAAGLLKALGQGRRIEELQTAMNRAAETAVPMAKDLLVSAVNTMSVDDARRILTGGETSVTDFFAGRTREPLGLKFLPIVTRVTDKVGLAEKYNRVASKVAGYGLVKEEDANVQKYVTRKSLDGLYLMIGEEEKKIRQNPLGAADAVLRKVFGALK